LPPGEPAVYTQHNLYGNGRIFGLSNGFKKYGTPAGEKQKRRRENVATQLS